MMLMDESIRHHIEWPLSCWRRTMDDGRKLVCDQDEAGLRPEASLAEGFCRAWRPFVVGQRSEIWLAIDCVDFDGFLF
jgi:hypothetical protein